MKKTTIFLMAALLAIGLGTVTYGATSSTLSVSDSHTVSVTVAAEHKIKLASSGGAAVTFSDIKPTDSDVTEKTALDELTYATNKYNATAGSSLTIQVSKGSDMPGSMKLKVYVDDTSETGGLNESAVSAAQTSEGLVIPTIPSGTATAFITGISSNGEVSNVDLTYTVTVPAWGTAQQVVSPTVTYELIGT